jgi:NADPH:quinone reductase-like Zn-dependent oxidoreductase
MMQAITIDGYGGLEKLQLRELPIPEPKAGEVRIRVRAAGVGIWDSLQRSGAFPPAKEVFPMIVGAECAGTVDATGENVNGPLHEGDEVYTYFTGVQGAYAQYVCVKADFVALKPKNLTFEEAAAVPVDAITAHQALVDELRVDAEMSTLVAGASGGVGTLAVQIAAKMLGARVIATTGKTNLSYVRDLGAAAVVDYSASDVISAVKQYQPDGVAVALDCVGIAGNAKTTIRAVRDGGRFAELVGEDVPAERGITIAHIESAPSAKRLDTLRPFFENGKLCVEIAQTFPLADARRAQEAVETRHTRGKIVLVVD